MKSVTFFTIDNDRGFSAFIVVVCGTFGLEILGWEEAFAILFGVVAVAFRFVVAGTETFGFCSACLPLVFVLADGVVLVVLARTSCGCFC